MSTERKKLAVWKFASCDGCQLSILDCEDELLPLANTVTIAYFPEATQTVLDGPYDISLVEGSITTQLDSLKILEIRKNSKFLISIGACATAGGIQALRNYVKVSKYLKAVYAQPEYIDTLETSTPISDHVHVDFELRGCPVNKQQLLELLVSFLHGKRPNIHAHSVCLECKLNGFPCVAVSSNVPCLGPVTHAGCGALCPQYYRGCFGCFGPKENANTKSLADFLADKGNTQDDIMRLFRSFNSGSPVFAEESKRHQHHEQS